MYPRVFEIYQNDLRPALLGHAFIRKSGAAKDLTGLVSCKFFMRAIDNGVLGAMKINGVAGAIVAPSTGQLSYTWAGTDTDTVGKYMSWFIGYWGGGSMIPETFTGPEVIILPFGSRAVH